MVNLTDQEAPRVLTVNELSAMLRATMGFEIAQIQLGSLGWNPRVIRQSAVVSEVEMIGNETFRVPRFALVQRSRSRIYPSGQATGKAAFAVENYAAC